MELSTMPRLQRIDRTRKAGMRGAAPNVLLDKNSTQPSSSTRSTLTVLTDAPTVPMSVIKAEERGRQIAAQIGTAHIQHPSLFEQSFAESQVNATAFAALTHPTLHCGPRWVGIQQTYRLEKETGADFLKLLRDLARLWMEENNTVQSNDICTLFDTHNVFLPDDRDPSHFLRPDVFVQGIGSLFPMRPSTGKSPSWCSCVAIGDAKLHQTRKKAETFAQLGTYAEQVFSAQENRRFLHTFYFDNSHLVWCTFDRGGAVHGNAVDYHIDHWKLCALVLRFLFDGKDLGFDTSISYERGSTLIHTTPPPEQIDSSREDASSCIPKATYIVRRTLFHSTTIRGSGSIYWLVRHHLPLDESRDDGTENWFIIKDTWVINGCDRERRIYDRIHRSLTQDESQGSVSQGILPEGQGITALVFTHNILFNNRLDSVPTNRPPGVNTRPEDNRVHTRAVFRATAGAKLLDQFSSAMELLVALRDVVQGHRRLYDHGVLHRDITPFRILIQVDAQEGDRGVLLDFESAVEMDSSTPRAGAAGSLAFYSRASAKAIEKRLAFTHSYFDDLESCFYILCYLVVCYPATGSVNPKSIPPSVSPWFTKSGGWEQKSNMMLEHAFPWAIDGSFQRPVFELLTNLHNLFRVYAHKAMAFGIGWRPEPEEAYDKFLGLLNDAIDDLWVYEAIAQPGPAFDKLPGDHAGNTQCH